MSDQQFKLGLLGDMESNTSTVSKQNASRGTYKGLSITPYLTGSDNDPSEVSYRQLTKAQKELAREEERKLENFKYFRKYREEKFERKHGYPLSWKEHEIRPILYRKRGEVTFILEENPHSMILKKKEFYPDKLRSGGGRSNVTDYSMKSRKRFYEKLLTINWKEIPVDHICFATLTYPGQYPKDGKDLKRQLDNLSKRLMRFGSDYGGLAFVWKLEFQKRGAPHYHLIVVTERPLFLPDFRSWLSTAWADIVRKWMEEKQLDPDLIQTEYDNHVKAGIEADPVKKSKAGMISYLALYIGGKEKKKAKEYQHHLPEEYSNVGRWWGIYGKQLKKNNTKIKILTEEEFYLKMFEFREYWEKNDLPDYSKKGNRIALYSFAGMRN
jgi:hypothetical protein